MRLLSCKYILSRTFLHTSIKICDLTFFIVLKLMKSILVHYSFNGEECAPAFIRILKRRRRENTEMFGADCPCFQIFK